MDDGSFLGFEVSKHIEITAGTNLGCPPTATGSRVFRLFPERKSLLLQILTDQGKRRLEMVFDIIVRPSEP